MRAFKLQCSVLTVMMVMVMSSPSLYNCTDECKTLLKDIQNEAGNPKDLTKEDLNISVPKIFNRKCTRDFFCLAEKVLEDVTFSHNNIHVRQQRNTKSVGLQRQGFKDDKKLERLKRHLHQYNNMTGQTRCHLSTIETHGLQTFLIYLAKCACVAYNHTS